MHVIYLAVTILAALANGYAAGMNFAGAESVKLVADRVHVSRRWMVPLGTVLASGTAGLLAGVAVPALGTAAAIGLVLYFVCAVSAHVRVRDRGIGGAVFFLVLAAAALAAGIADHRTVRLNLLRSRRARREDLPGHIPDLVVTAERDGPEHDALLADSVSPPGCARSGRGAAHRRRRPARRCLARAARS